LLRWIANMFTSFVIASFSASTPAIELLWPRQRDQTPIRAAIYRAEIRAARCRFTDCRPHTWRPMTGQVTYCVRNPERELVPRSGNALSPQPNSGRTSACSRGDATLMSMLSQY
jgi:hypothetical protein